LRAERAARPARAAGRPEGVDWPRAAATGARRSRRSADRCGVEERVAERTTDLLTALAERESQLQEVHQRVGDNLSVISNLIDMQTVQVRDAAGRRALGACRGRIVAIARIHDLLYRANDHARVPFSAYARGLATDLHKALPVAGARIALEFVIDEVALPLSTAIPCGLVLNEWITNALEHEFVGRASGAVRISLSRQGDGRVRIDVSDDGVGLPDGFDVQQCQSLGMQLVCALAKPLRAQIAVEAGRGAVVRADRSGHRIGVRRAMAPRVGLEPTTRRLTAACSAN
jgi:two-component sensor histidine kinase